MEQNGRLALIAFAALAASGLPAHAAEPVDFARDVYPILQRACLECHGPLKQKGDLRLDRPDAVRGNPTIIAKGNAADSELVRRISLPPGDDEIMPSRGAPLTKAEIAKIRTWIDQGAPWPDDLTAVRHWAHVRPAQARPPKLDVGDNILRNPIDVWVLARLQQSGLSFSAPAEKTAQIRRVSLDLIGLPPTPAEVEAFVQDDSPDAYERLVDRLLASPQYGVRWARPWLDYARYADSHGFQRDDFRDLWPYRDWVVDALNDDMPFTQFTIEQLAGDLLPDATAAQRVATGFNRSSPTNVEAGTDPEETRVNQVHDRINTLGAVWLGSTLECAQCHDHKYDPFTQRDYYGLFAFFNNTALEADRTDPKVPGSIQFKGPTMEVADALAAERFRLRLELEQVSARVAGLTQEAEASVSAWESELRTQIAQGAEQHVLPIEAFESTGGATHEILADQSVLISGEPAPDKDTYVVTAHTQRVDICGIRLEALTDESLPGKGPGRGDAQRPNFVLNNVHLVLAPTNEPDQARPVKFTQAQASFSQANFPVANLLKTDNGPKGGWAIGQRFHEPHWAVLQTAEALGFEGGTRLTLKLEQNFGAGRTIGRLRVSLITGSPGARIWPAEVIEAVRTPAAERTEKQRQDLIAFHLRENPKFVRLDQEQTKLQTQLRNLKPPSTLVMREDTPRPSVIFQRGSFRTPGDAVQPSTPAALHPFPAIEKPTRLDLARWLVSRDNPLVARVVVNRWWAELFGHGLVATPEDFGIKGERPIHPELLDWLACEFMDQGWSQKRLLKTIVMSTTYRQSSRITPQLLAADDRNLLYSRGPRHRLEAELIRDNALAIAGLLNPRLGGPPIRPAQPEGLWIKVGGQKYDYETSPSDEKYRRGLYVVWKRGAPYPSFVSFDANNRMACRVHRPRSNTPLQALVLMNDPVYVEAALAFARRVLDEQPQADDAARIRHAFRLALSRSPQEGELAILLQLLEAERAARAAGEKGTSAFLATSPVPQGVAPAEFAAWYAVAATLLNLDECISKG